MKKKAKIVKVFLYDMTRYLLDAAFPRGPVTKVKGLMIDHVRTSEAWDLGTGDTLIEAPTLLIDEKFLTAVDVLVGVGFKRVLVDDHFGRKLYAYESTRKKPDNAVHINEWPTDKARTYYGVAT